MANKQTDVCGTHFPSCGPTRRAPDLGYAARFSGIFLALAESRFEGESTLPPQAGNASRWATVLQIKVPLKLSFD